MAQKVLRIAHLYPTLMNLYGDRGNIRALQYRAALRGLKTEVTQLSIGDAVRTGHYHVYFFGGGQDVEQDLIYEDYLQKKGAALKEEIESGAAFLAVCGGYQLLGKNYEVFGGRVIDGIGALNLHTTAGQERSIGNILVEVRLGDCSFEMVGFENHGGQTWLGEGLRPLGTVLVGRGNNGQDGSEGVVYKNTIGTYMHGPVLPKNPRLSDFLIEAGIRRLSPGFALAPAASDAEDAAFASARAITMSGRRQKRDLFKRQERRKQKTL